MADNGHLVSEFLFAQTPQTGEESTDRFYETEFVRSASNQDLIDLTYHILRNGNLTVDETLKLWEIRLTLTLFNDQLALARKEAVNLNNALYIRENPNAPPPSQSRMNSSQSLNEAGQNAQTSGPIPANVVYPLPKNNDGQIGYNLLLIILRLKSVPNLILVNEIYKICYQMRLKGTSSEAAALLAKLTNLSYEVIMVLLITRNSFTLISFLDSLRQDVQTKIDNADNSSHSKRLYSNVCLLEVLVTLMVWAKSTIEAKEQSVPPQVTDLFGKVDEVSLASLKFVLQNVHSTVGGPESEDSKITMESLTLAKLAQLVKDKTISLRTVCCTLATWELSNVYQTELDEDEGKLRLVVEALGEPKSKLDRVYAEIIPRWGQYVNKVYGLE